MAGSYLLSIKVVTIRLAAEWNLTFCPRLVNTGILFYAYGPLGGVFFSTLAEHLRSPPAGGRKGQMKTFQMKTFQMIYVNHPSLNLLQDLTEMCAKEGSSKDQPSMNQR